MGSHYGYGKRKELQVAEFLEVRGFGWERSVGSRGAIDLIARKGSRRLAIQVKATRRDYSNYTRLTIQEERALLRSASRFKARPILALVSRNYVWLVTVPHDTVLLEGNLARLRYDYPDES